MNPRLLQHSNVFDLPLSSEAKYLGHDRSFSNLASFAANDYPFSTRRTQADLTNSAAASTLTLPANSSLEYNSQPLLNNGTYHSTSQLLLSPPDSVNGSASANGSSTLVSFPYTTLPKPYPSNTSTTEHFPSVSGSVLSSNWVDSTVAGLDRSRVSTFPSTLSPPLTYTSANGIPSAFLTRPSIDRGYPPYQSPNSSMTATYLAGNGLRPTPHPYPYRSGHFGIPSAPANGYSMSQLPANPEPARQEGPPFGDTNVIFPVATTNRRDLLRPEISANIQKGFFQVDGKWTCYRRNYFTVCCSFGFKNHLPEGSFYIQRHGPHGHSEQVQQFAVSISAKTAAVNSQDSEPRGLVQHTPKRDKATESVPERHQVQPTSLQSLHSNGNMGVPSALYSSSHGVSSAVLGSFGFESAGHQSVPTAYTFERIQFQKATANNGKRRAQQQYFHVVVELSANVARNPVEENWVVIATKESDPIVVRGRSPGHYKDNARRDSHSSMDPDRGAGHASNNNSVSYSFGSSHNSAMDWVPGPRPQHHNNYHNYDIATYRTGELLNASEYSPTSAASSTTLTGSPSDIDFALPDTQAVKSSNVYSMNHSEMSPQSEVSADTYFNLNGHVISRKRRREDDSADELSSYRSTSALCDAFPNRRFEFSAISNSKALCVSS